MYKIAVVQPRNYQRGWKVNWPVTFGPDAKPAETQLANALEWMEKAKNGGACLCVFPELYPGPCVPSVDRPTYGDVEIFMRDAAKRVGIWTIYGSKADDGNSGTYNQLRVISPDGRIAAEYNKLIPASNENNTPGDDGIVVDCGDLKVGLLICWEMWFPEISRILRFKGADILVAPTGALVYELGEAWKTVAQARALENDCYSAITVNLFGLEDGMCQVAGPEGVVASMKGEGILFADIDLERLKFMRETDEDIIVPKPYRGMPGLLKWLRPEVIDLYHATGERFMTERKKRLQ
jgi:5-aminopentanamidase